MLAMQRAIDGLSLQAEFALIDGNRDHGSRVEITTPHEMVIGGDGVSPSIAAASILAKVSRDRYMEEMADQYPEYEFGKHKGYPTKRHYELLREFGPCPIHRRSFLKKLWAAGQRPVCWANGESVWCPNGSENKGGKSRDDIKAAHLKIKNEFDTFVKEFNNYYEKVNTLKEEKAEIKNDFVF